MTKRLTRRAARRKPIEAAVTCRPYASEATVSPAEGVMLNFSGGGSYIETCRTFKPGTILVVRMLHCPPMPSMTAGADQPRTICLAEVKWQHELSVEAPNRYGLGLRYLQ